MKTKDKRGKALNWILIILILIAIGVGVYLLFFSGAGGNGGGLLGGSSVPQPPALPS